MSQIFRAAHICVICLIQDCLVNIRDKFDVNRIHICFLIPLNIKKWLIKGHQTAHCRQNTSRRIVPILGRGVLAHEDGRFVPGNVEIKTPI